MVNIKAVEFFSEIPFLTNVFSRSDSSMFRQEGFQKDKEKAMQPVKFHNFADISMLGKLGPN